MTAINGATVEVGDYLRVDETGAEGAVESIDGDQITLRFPPNPFFPDGDTWIGPATACHYNSWDPKFVASAKQAPKLQATDMATANQDVTAAVQAEQEALIADAQAAVEAVQAAEADTPTE